MTLGQGIEREIEELTTPEHGDNSAKSRNPHSLATLISIILIVSCHSIINHVK